MAQYAKICRLSLHATSIAFLIQINCCMYDNIIYHIINYTGDQSKLDILSFVSYSLGFPQVIDNPYLYFNTEG